MLSDGGKQNIGDMKGKGGIMEEKDEKIGKRRGKGGVTNTMFEEAVKKPTIL